MTSNVANVIEQSDVRSRALLVWLTVSTWTARKLDKRVTAETNARHAACDKASRVNKLLLPGEADSYRALLNYMAETRMQHYARTLAWSDEGWRVLATAAYMDYTEWYRVRKAETERLAEAFYADYPTLKDQAKALLNGMFREEDYPDVVDVRKKFDMSIQFNPIPSTGDVRVDLPADQISMIEQTIADHVTSAVDVAMADVRQRLYTVVGKMRDKLSDPEAIFRDSLVENVKDLCDTLTTLNITQDTNLEAFRQSVAQDLASISPDILRDNMPIRLGIAEKADQIMSQMSAVYGDLS